MTELQILNPRATGNSSFSEKSPGMQLAVDSTSLGAFKSCPRYYQLSIVEGWQPRGLSPHLTFGLHLHRARETYDHAKARGADHEEALDAALDEALKATWDSELGRPWLSDHNLKNRKTLIQSLVWYLDAFGKNDPLETLVLANGKPAVELSFRFDSTLRTADGEVILLCGHLDRMALLNDWAYIVDIKTSARAVDASWALGFTPGNQFSLYSLAGKVAFNVEVAGLIVDGVQVGVGFSRFQRHLIQRSESQLEEWFEDTEWWLKMMEAAARRQHWPQNDKACDMFGGCAFRSVCSRPPGARAAWLKADFVKRVWDPLQVRGEI